MIEFLKRYPSAFFLIPLFFKKSLLFFNYPRLWAEEGTIYFKNAVEFGFKSLFFYHQGYFSIIPNITLYIASLFNYAYTPYFTIGVSFIFWIILFTVILGINEKPFRDNYILKNTTFIAVFYILNYYQEIFLNTINLQFITGIILFFLSLYNFEKLPKIQYYLISILIYICLLNGTLYMPFLPLLIYKLYKAEKYLNIIGMIFLISLLNIGVLFQTNELSIYDRMISNINLKYEIYKTSTLIDIFKDNYYLILLPFIFFSFLTKKKFFFIIGVSILTSYLFIDYTKYENFGGRYRAFILSLLNVYIILLLQKHKNVLIFFSITLITYFSSYVFRHSYSNNFSLPLWKNEYRNLYNNKPAKIQPETWEIELKKPHH